MRMPTLALLTASIALFSGCASTIDQTSSRQPLLAGGHGVDHVTILTSDVAAAADEYANRLGFTVGPARRHSFGFTSAYIYFADDTFIELSGIHDEAKVVEVGEGFAFQAAEGVRWVTLHSGSTAFLNGWIEGKCDTLVRDLDNYLRRLIPAPSSTEHCHRGGDSNQGISLSPLGGNRDSSLLIANDCSDGKTGKTASNSSYRDIQLERLLDGPHDDLLLGQFIAVHLDISDLKRLP